MITRTRHFQRTRRGSAATEFAILLPLLVMMFSGMVDLSWQLSRYQHLVRVTRDAARVAAATYENPQYTEPGSLSIPAAEDYVTEALTLVNMPCSAGSCTIEVQRLETTPPQMQVSISYTVDPIVGLFPLDNEVHAQFSMAYEFL
jgi:Flp pilus assembly protein TadG